MLSSQYARAAFEFLFHQSKISNSSFHDDERHISLVFHIDNVVEVYEKLE